MPVFPFQTISSDSNAEKLSAHYEPHVCLTRDALIRLLDNHGPDFEEQWEVPVWVKLNPGKGKTTWCLLSCHELSLKKSQETQKEFSIIMLMLCLVVRSLIQHFL